jgi:hypothetical protein
MGRHDQREDRKGQRPGAKPRPQGRTLDGSFGWARGTRVGCTRLEAW